GLCSGRQAVVRELDSLRPRREGVARPDRRLFRATGGRGLVRPRGGGPALRPRSPGGAQSRGGPHTLHRSRRLQLQPGAAAVGDTLLARHIGGSRVSRLSWVLGIAMLLAASSEAASADQFVIANPSVSISGDDIREVYLGEKQFAGEQKLVPVDNA